MDAGAPREPDGAWHRGGSGAAGSVTHSPDSPLFGRRTGLGGPTPLVRTGATPGATRPISVEPDMHSSG